MLLRNIKLAVLSLAVAGVLGVGVVEDADAQARRDRSDRSSKGKEVNYPAATRQEPQAKGAPKLASSMQKMIDAYNKDDYATARSLADEILANETATAYNRAVAAQIASQAAYNTDDEAGTRDYLQKAVTEDALDNNNHYQLMLMLAQLQLQEDQYEQGLATLDRYLTETQSQKPLDYVIKGQALYQMERYSEAIPVLKHAIELSPEPQNAWLQLLMASYAEADMPNEAIALAEQVAAKDPGDKRVQLNLATVYMQADRLDKATEVLERLRAAGQLTEDREYRQLYGTYLNQDGKEKEAAAAINEGLEKGILKPDYQAYLALAQSYYFSEQIGPAIEAYKKAGPLSQDGETFLNLARIYWQEDRIPEAKQAAKAALDKGLKKPEDARKILALP